MGLRSAVRKKIVKMFLVGLINDVQKGEYGEEARKSMQWIKEHKGPIGTVFAFISGGLVSIGYPEAATAIGMLSALLLGGAYIKTDKQQKREEGK